MYTSSPHWLQREPMEQYETVTVIGCGVFGLSTALALAKRWPQTTIHLVDRVEPPVPDGSSVDTTRCLRADYKDDVYAQLAKESMEIITADEELNRCFRRCGMSFVYDGKDDKWAEMWRSSKATAQAINGEENIESFEGHEEVFGSIHGESPGALDRESWWNRGYRNKTAGFIDAAKAIKVYYEKTKQFSNIHTTFKPVSHLLIDDSKTARGVQFEDGTTIESSLVIVAAGAWSAKLVPLKGITNQSCIEVAWFAVTPEESERWKDMSITTNFTTGINLFPPHEGEIKILRRSPGYINTIDHEGSKISYPRTILSNPDDWIPEEAETALRENMREIMPSLHERPFIRTKLCWLTQTTTSNFLIDHHPELQNVVMTTGGSAHGWKFVPLLGDKVVDLIEGKLDPVLKRKWSWGEKLDTGDQGAAVRLAGEQVELKDVVRVRPA